MNVFKSFTLTWWQASLFKLSVLSFGLILGSVYYTFFSQWTLFLAVVFVVTTVSIIAVWWKQ